MSDLVTDGTRLWARIRFRLRGGRVIDPAKIMLVDTGAPFTGISASNLDPDLNLIGLTSVAILGCAGLGIVLDGGEMILNLDGVDVSCTQPVVYSPCFLTDILGLDQIIPMGILRGLRIVPSSPRPFVSLPPTPLGVLYPLIAPLLTIRPGTYPFQLTPRPGMFAFLGPMVPQGSYIAVGWEFAQYWPQAILAGSEFDVAVAFTARQPLEFASISFEVPFGFKILSGDPSRSIPSPGAGAVEEIHLRLLAPRAAGDYFWRSTIRTAGREGELVRSVDGRLVVRDQLRT